MLVQLPESTHGVSVVNQSIIKSELIRKNYYLDYVDISTSKNINEIDVFKFKKIFIFLKSFLITFKKIFFIIIFVFIMYAVNHFNPLIFIKILKSYLH